MFLAPRPGLASAGAQWEGYLWQGALGLLATRLHTRMAPVSKEQHDELSLYICIFISLYRLYHQSLYYFLLCQMSKNIIRRLSILPIPSLQQVLPKLLSSPNTDSPQPLVLSIL